MNLHGGNNLLHTAHSATSSTLFSSSFFFRLSGFMYLWLHFYKIYSEKPEKGKHLHIIN